jgi:hypothetical protein
MAQRRAAKEGAEAVLVARGSSSVVEHRLAKARVASSNLVFRSTSPGKGPTAGRDRRHRQTLGSHAG